jgi:hypothetical protein
MKAIMKLAFSPAWTAFVEIRSIYFASVLVLSLVSLNATAQFTKADSNSFYKWRKITLTSLNNTPKGTFSYSNQAFFAADLYAIKNDKDSTFYFLNEAINSCPYTSAKCAEAYLSDVLGTCFFTKWHSTKEWKDFETKLSEGFYKIYGNVKEPRLAFDLIKAKGADQTLRYYYLIIKSGANASKSWGRIDSINLAFIKNVVHTYGYPGLSMVGKEGANAAFLLCQHADKDLDFQKKILANMQLLMQKNDVPADNYAYLTDRIMVGEKGVQLYGTQFKKRDVLYPIVDSIHVDERRRKMGLSTLAEYKNGFDFFGD